MHRRRFVGLLATGAVRCAVGSTGDSHSNTTAEPPSATHASWLARLPKVELHVHLEGAIPRSALWELITKYGGHESLRTRDDLDRTLVYQDFRHFLDVEAFFSPPDFRRSPLVPQRVAEAIRAGLREVPSIEVALIADLVRDRGTDHAAQLLERIAEVRNLGVIGIGIGGWEPGSLNTDDPLFFGNSLAGELAAVQRHHGFTREEITRLVASSIESSWLPADRKSRLAETLRTRGLCWRREWDSNPR